MLCSSRLRVGSLAYAWGGDEGNPQREQGLTEARRIRRTQKRQIPSDALSVSDVFAGEIDNVGRRALNCLRLLSLLESTTFPDPNNRQNIVPLGGHRYIETHGRSLLSEPALRSSKSPKLRTAGDLITRPGSSYVFRFR